MTYFAYESVYFEFIVDLWLRDYLLEFRELISGYWINDVPFLVQTILIFLLKVL